MEFSNGQVYMLRHHVVLFMVSLLVLGTPYVEGERRSLATAIGPHTEYAEVEAIPEAGTKFFGSSGKLYVWDPVVSREEDSSRTSIVIELTDEAFLEAGWIVDNGKETGCFDLDCEGFQLFDESSILGQPVKPVSVEGEATSFFVDVLIFQGPSSESWQLNVGGMAIGVWPASLFPGLIGAQKIYWGGTVFDSIGNTEHTTTEMGNGLFPNITTRHASRVCSLQFVDSSNNLQTPDRDMLGLGVTNPNCYDAELLPVTDTANGVCFLFGGPGRNPDCP